MFMNKRYEEAIEFFSKAIEFSTENTEGRHIFFANRAAALNSLERYEEAIIDATKSIELEPKYLKAYLRKAQAERELLLNDDALSTLDTALALEEESTQLSELYEEHKKEWEEDHQLDPSHESMVRFT